jgi:hypothetical protein
MSYPATLSTVDLLGPSTRHATADHAVSTGRLASEHSARSAPSAPSDRSAPSNHSPGAQRRRRRQLSDLQLLPWLRLAARQLLGPELQERIEPYRPCLRCVRQARWCGEGCNTPEPAGGALQRLDLLTPSVILGAKADPYPLAEALQRRTRGLLDALRSIPALDALPSAAGMQISIFTRSPRILRDLDLLAELDQRHMVTVGVLIPAASAALVRRLEGPPSEAPGLTGLKAAEVGDPGPRFELVRTLAAHGIAANVICTPVVPGINNGAAGLGRLFQMAWQAGASDVRPAPRHPALPPSDAESRHLLAFFRRLRLEQGFPRISPGRG